MSVDVSSAVAAVDLGVVKHHLRVEIDDDDTLIESYVLAATQKAEHILGREIIKRAGEDALAADIDGVPAAVRAWICLEVTDLYEKRSISESGLGQGRRNYDHLLDAFRVF